MYLSFVGLKATREYILLLLENQLLQIHSKRVRPQNTTSPLPFQQQDYFFFSQSLLKTPQQMRNIYKQAID